MKHTLKDLLLSEIEGYDTACPPVEMWIDEVGNVFWQSKIGHMVLIDNDRCGIEKYIDNLHQKGHYTSAVENYSDSPDCIQGEYVVWNNADFENPFHISDFTKQIKTITF